MVKEYWMTGVCPIVVSGYGRVEPDTGNFQCEMEPAQEAFLMKIGAVRIVRELPDASHAALPAERVDGDLETLDGKKLATWPSGWPRRGVDEGTVSDFEPEAKR